MNFLLLFYVLFLAGNVQTLIRNDITDRCLHIISSRDDVSLVRAASCSWSDFNTSVNPNIVLEIAPKEADAYIIRKVFEGTSNPIETCLSVADNRPVGSTSCDSEQSLFHVDVVEQSNFHGMLTSHTSYKLRNSYGKCLTVRPGQAEMEFRDCSSRQGLFQVWSTCRHNQMCDVPFTWTARKISFPKNQTDVDVIPGDHATKLDVGNLPTETSNNIVNEFLFTVQNAVRLYDHDELFIIHAVAAFFPNETIFKGKALVKAICKQEQSQCAPCQDIQQNDGDLSHLSQSVALVMRWMAHCNDPQMNVQYKRFLATDVLQIPSHLFPSHDPSFVKSKPQVDKYKLIIPDLRNCLKNFEMKVKETDTGTDISLHGNKGQESIREDVSGTEKKETKPNYVSLIDIRMFEASQGKNETKLKILRR